MPQTSIIVPTVKEREVELRRLLGSIEKSTYQDFEIIVEDGVGGLAPARNRGVRKAVGRYVLFIDDDNVVGESMVKELVKVMDKHDNVVAVGPVTYYLSEPERVWFAGARYSLWTSKPYFYRFSYESVDDLKPVESLHNCFMVRGEAGEEVGWFDEGLVMGGTEVDFFLRVMRKNAEGYENAEKRGNVVVHPGAKCYHGIPTPEQDRLRSLGFNHPRRAYYFQRNRGYLLGRHGNLLQRIVLGAVFYPFFTVIYAVAFALEKRWDLLRAHLKGTWDGYKYLILR